MTTYYVGPGGSDTNSGLTWALRKASIASANQAATQAGDVIILGPGRHVLEDYITMGDKSLSGDPGGDRTDGIGGEVVITNENTSGLWYTSSTTYWVSISGATQESILENITFHIFGNADIVSKAGTTGTVHIRSCVFKAASKASGISGVDVFNMDNTGGGVYVADCIFMGLEKGVSTTFLTTLTLAAVGVSRCVFVNCKYGLFYTHAQSAAAVASANNTFMGCTYGVYTTTSSAVTYTLSKLDAFISCLYGVYASSTTPTITCSHDAFYQVGTNYTNIDTQTESRTQNGTSGIIWAPGLPLLKIGFKTDLDFFGASLLSNIQWYDTYTSNPAGNTKDVFNSPKNQASSGAISPRYGRDAIKGNTVYDSSTKSIELPNMGEYAVIVPTVAGKNISVSVRVYRETDYAGTLPALVVHGLDTLTTSISTSTDTGSSGTWNLLTVSNFTPVGEFTTITLRSSNTADSGNFRVFFDSLEVTE